MKLMNLDNLSFIKAIDKELADKITGGQSLAASVSAANQIAVAAPPSTQNYDCEGIYCHCEGDDDCNDMFLTAGCGDIAVCYDDGTCECYTI